MTSLFLFLTKQTLRIFVICLCSSPFAHILQLPHHYFCFILNQLVLIGKITLRNFKNINKNILSIFFLNDKSEVNMKTLAKGGSSRTFWTLYQFFSAMNRATDTVDTALESPDVILFDAVKILVIRTPREELLAQTWNSGKYGNLGKFTN